MLHRFKYMIWAVAKMIKDCDQVPLRDNFYNP